MAPTRAKRVGKLGASWRLVRMQMRMQFSRRVGGVLDTHRNSVGVEYSTHPTNLQIQKPLERVENDGPYRHHSGRSAQAIVRVGERGSTGRGAYDRSSAT